MKKRIIIFVFFLFSIIGIASCAKVEFSLNFMVDNKVYHTIHTNGKEVITMPADPVKEGYDFAGWFWDKDVWSKDFTANSLLDTPLSKNMEVHAKWRELEYTTYTLENLVIKSTLMNDYYIDPNDMSSQEKLIYNQTIDLYGRSVKINNVEVIFEGLVLAQFNPAKYSLNGRNVVFENGELKSTFTYVTLENGLFSLGVVTGGNGIVFEYYSPDYLIPNYKLIFDYDGASGGNSINECNVQFNHLVGILPFPTKTGYTFVGWYNNDIGLVKEDTKFIWKKDIILKAQWTAKSYKMNYDYNGATGGNFETYKTVEYDAAVGNLPNPTKTGYDFVGWFTQPNGSGTQVTSSYIWKFNTDTNIYAHYNGKQYTLTFNYEGATGGDSTTGKPVVYGEPVGNLPIPTKTGNTFSGWYTSAGGLGTKYEASTIYNSSGAISLYAKWETTIYFNYEKATGGNTVSNQKVIYNNSVGTLPTPTRTGYTFGGWYTDIAGNGTNITSNTKYSINGEVQLYAKWTSTITFDYQSATGGTSTSSITVTYNKAVGTLPTPTRTGYTFGGWYTQTNGSGNVYNSSTLYIENNGIYLYAKWVANGYIITFDNQGGTSGVSSSTFYYDAALGTLPTPMKAGNNVFGGWYTNTAGTGTQYTTSTIYKQTSGITLYAKWTTEIIFDYDDATSGNTVDKISIVYYSNLPTLPRPYKVGYSFEGWYYGDIEYTVGMRFTGSGAQTFKAKWVVGTDKSYLSYTLSGNIVTVSGLSTSGKALTEIVIPSIINGYSVTTISANAFASLGLTKVTIPNSVTSIGQGAFRDCLLTEITLPFIGSSRATSSGYSMVFGYIFGYTTGNSTTPTGTIYQYYSSNTYYYYYIPSTLKKVTITDISSIPTNAFRNCTMLNEINLTSNVTSVLGYGFSGCTNLDTINGLNRITNVGEYAFSNCKKLLSLNELASLNSIGEYSFNNCFLLNNVTLSNTLTSIGDYAFNATGLQNITIPNSVMTIGNSAFKDCLLNEMTLPFIGTSRTTTSGYNMVFGYIFGYETGNSTTPAGTIYQFYSSNSYYYYYIPSTLSKVTITDISTIPTNAFRNCKMLNEINLMSNVTSVLGYGFSGCTNLDVITGLNNVVNVSEYAFNNCTRLQSINNLGTLNIIGSNAFNNCNELVQVTFSSTLTIIGSYAFNGCINLQTISLPNSLKTIEDYAFASSRLNKITIPNSVTSIGQGVFKDCLLTEITLPFIGTSRTTTSGYNMVFGYIFGYVSGNSTTPTGTIYQFYSSNTYYYYYIPSSLNKITITDISTIPTNAFRNCTMINEINLTSNVTSVLGYGFSGCTNLESINGLENVINVGEYAFNNCGRLQSLNELGSLVSVGDGAFRNCILLTQVSLSESLTSIGEYAFAASGLTKIIVPNSVTNIGRGAFKDCLLIEISLPFVGTSKTTTSGYDMVFGYIFDYTTGNSTTPSGTIYQFSSGNTYYYYYIPSTLTKVTITNISTIPGNAFRNCSMISEINLTSIVTSISGYGFSGCTNLDVINGLTSVVNVGDYAYNNCIKLQSLNELPSLNSIGNNAFANCKLLTEVSLSNSLVAIGNYAFSGCNNLESILLPNSLQTIGDYSFTNTGLTIMIVPNSVTSIGQGAFKDCLLTEITLPFIGTSKTTTSGYDMVFGYIFGYVTGNSTTPSGTIYQFSSGNTYYYYYIPSTLTKVTITDITSIPSNAFRNCSMIKEIIISSNITSISSYGFNGCTYLESLTLSSIIPPTLDSTALSNTNSNLVIYVPLNAVEDYKAAWTLYVDKINGL